MYTKSPACLQLVQWMDVGVTDTRNSISYLAKHQYNFFAYWIILIDDWYKLQKTLYMWIFVMAKAFI